MNGARLHVSDLAVARVAARRARAVPGVTALFGDARQALRGLAADRLPREPVPDELRTRGVVATVDGREAEIRVTVGVRLGTPCAELAARVRREVAEEVAAVTGLTARVHVTIADIALPR
ncbi:Asp23/Gls24 family envelope stress response protein [Pseudonocardia sp. C8]|uniref:Asp23/Gls24 family envelope stress response protein n=1 Tax=Pseudonocardia sp. C8 TaxID=2762759 RepID=UPI001642B07F|nr:Asp23/Gls24 family envelope stress response protein [Pseudonocardia sp. C8]MBC3193303.1 Asp23/Gls24 family envelope stress response protein [Pseudonocardia sp. C8]